MKIKPEIIICFILVLSLTIARAEEIVFEKKLNDGRSLICEKKMASAARFAKGKEKEALAKKFREASGDDASVDITSFAPPTYALKFWLVANGKRQKCLWATEEFEAMLFDDGFRPVPRDIEGFQLFDAWLDEDTIVVVARRHGAAFVDIGKTEEKKQSNRLTKFWRDERAAVRNPVWPEAAKINGLLVTNTLSVTITFSDGRNRSERVWRWDGKEWIEEKKTDK